MRTWRLILSCVLLLLAGASWGGGQPGGVDIYLFWQQGCPHCEREIAYLQRLQREEPAIRVHDFEIRHHAANLKLMARVSEALRVETASVPLLVIGDQVFVGYIDDAFSGARIKSAALACVASGCRDRVLPLLDGTASRMGSRGTATAPVGALPATFSLPLVGEIHLATLSLPALTVVIGLLDGFNPCAMWTLVFLLGLLLEMQDKKRMWILGGGFIAASAVVYFLFMAAWLNLMLFVGMLFWMRLLIGLVAVTSGGYCLKEYFSHAEEVCKVTAPEQRQRVFARLRALCGQHALWLALVGVVALAFAVNLVELVCSAGFPVVYTQVLAMSHLPLWQYYAYLLLYVLVFMLDDLLVFFVALTTLQLAGLTTRYVRFSHLVGGTLLLAIGVTLIFRPEWLMFGQGVFTLISQTRN